MNLLPLDRITKKIESNLVQDSPGLEHVLLVRIESTRREPTLLYDACSPVEIAFHFHAVFVCLEKLR